MRSPSAQMRANIRVVSAAEATTLLRNECFARIVFCGAGISHASGLPLANELKDILLRELCAKEKVLAELCLKRQSAWAERLEENRTDYRI